MAFKSRNVLIDKCSNNGNEIAFWYCTDGEKNWWEVRTPELDMDFDNIDLAARAYDDECLNWLDEPNYNSAQEASYVDFLEQMGA